MSLFCGRETGRHGSERTRASHSEAEASAPTNLRVKNHNHFGRSRNELPRDSRSCGDVHRTGFRGELPRANPVAKIHLASVSNWSLKLRSEDQEIQCSFQPFVDKIWCLIFNPLQHRDLRVNGHEKWLAEYLRRAEPSRTNPNLWSHLRLFAGCDDRCGVSGYIVSSSAEFSFFLLSMCMEAPESTTDSLASGSIVDGARRHQSKKCEKTKAKPPKARRPGPCFDPGFLEFCTLHLPSPILLCGPIALASASLFLTEILEFWNDWISRMWMRGLTYLQRWTFSSRTVMKRSPTGVYRSRRSDLDHCPRSLWDLVTTGNILWAPFSFLLFCFRSRSIVVDQRGLRHTLARICALSQKTMRILSSSNLFN